MKDKAAIVEMLKERFVTKPELRDLFGLSDRKARLTMQYLKMEYPVISTCNRKGWKIATSEADISLAGESLAENRRKAITIFKGQKRLREFLESFGKNDFEQMTLDL